MCTSPVGARAAPTMDCCRICEVVLVGAPWKSFCLKIWFPVRVSTASGTAVATSMADRLIGNGGCHKSVGLENAYLAAGQRCADRAVGDGSTDVTARRTVGCAR